MAKSRKSIAPNDVYTAILGVATAVALVTSVIVAIKCISEYGTLFKIVNG